MVAAVVLYVLSGAYLLCVTADFDLLVSAEISVC